MVSEEKHNYINNILSEDIELVFHAIIVNCSVFTFLFLRDVKSIKFLKFNHPESR